MNTQKSVYQDATEPQYGGVNASKNPRGMQIVHFSQFYPVSGKDKNGNIVTGNVEYPFYHISPDERIEIFRLCSTVFSLVSGRMNRVSAMDWDVVSEHQIEDEIAYNLKSLYEHYRELKRDPNIAIVIARSRILAKLKTELPELLNDGSNFEACLLRWKRRIQFNSKSKCEEVEHWLEQPNIHMNFEEFRKAYVLDALVHGNVAVFKQNNTQTKLLENFYMLAGGTVNPLRTRYVGGFEAYVQQVNGIEPQIYFSDECSFHAYVPSSVRSYGFVPLESLINKVSEAMFFDRLMSDQADGTKPPEKVVVFGDKSSLDPVDTMMGQLPMNPEEQKRIETIMNEVKKTAIRTLSGVGQPMVLDLSKENTMAVQMQRQDQLDRHIAMVFNASNNEINQTGSDGTSGRATSETNADIDQGKGIMPNVVMFESFINKDILPFRFGSGFKFKFKHEKDQMAEMTKLQAMMQSGLYSVNEIRVKELNESPFEGDQFDLPTNSQPAQVGTAQSPVFMKSV
jgi:hypothetical protein